MLDLGPIEERLAAATPGPWCADPIEDSDGWFVHSNVAPTYPIVAATPVDGIDEHRTQSEPDAEFIAHAREDVGDLLAEVKTLRAALTDIAEHGLRADLNPTVQFGDDDHVYTQLTDYLRRCDAHIRERAQSALAR